MDRFTIQPSYTTASNTDQRLSLVAFGDGYEQRAPDGLNSMRRTYRLKFAKVRATKAQEVLAFLEAHGGTTAFIWTPPAPNDTPRAWVIRPPWDHQHDAFDAESITVTFEQDMNPAPRAETPVFTVGGTVTIATASVGASIRYTNDGAEPTETTGALYTGALPATSGITYKAIAYRADVLPSAIATTTI